jgi:hypothetical protein
MSGEIILSEININYFIIYGCVAVCLIGDSNRKMTEQISAVLFVFCFFWIPEMRYKLNCKSAFTFFGMFGKTPLFLIDKRDFFLHWRYRENDNKLMSWWRRYRAEVPYSSAPVWNRKWKCDTSCPVSSYTMHVLLPVSFCFVRDEVVPMRFPPRVKGL